jgi:diguanylate cyclase (GGDEF)-like protein
MGTLLIVDDSVEIRKKLIKILKSGKDFDEFLEADDGATGLKIMMDVENPVDVVACDLNMPGMNGYEFLRMLRSRPEFMSTPVVMVTSRSDDTEMVRAFELGANDFIAKPFNEAILKARLKNMLQMKVLQDQLREQKEMMEQMATTDHLTNIPNLRCFKQKFEAEFIRAVRYGTPLSIFLADLDHFKKINDTFGHPRGDSVLRESAQIIISVIRRVDFVARYGGEEFMVILPQTDQKGAAEAAERLRGAFEKHTFKGLENYGALTISIGVATYDKGMEADPEGLVGLADKALYAAKRGGRNKVEISREYVK